MFYRMLEERICLYEKRRQLQAACVENWQHSANVRRQRQQEELNIRRYEKPETDSWSDEWMMDSRMKEM